jgi:organic hydroperoxide reductase OsmC/OhrA
MQQIETPIKHRTLSYETELMKTEQRDGIVRSVGKPGIRISSPPEFKGKEGLWTPEHFFVAALDSCLMMTFLALAARNSLIVKEYNSQATGVLESENGVFSFTKVTLEPVVIVERIEEFEKAKGLLEEAHNRCFVANSVRSEVLMNPSIRWIP